MPKKVSSVCKEDKCIWSFFQTKLLKMILCTRRKQFLQPCQKAFVKGLKVFCSYLEKIKTPTTFSKNLILFNGFLSTRRFQVRQSCSKYSDKNAEKVWTKNETDKWIYTFSSKKTFVKMFLVTSRIQLLQQKKLCSLSKIDREFLFQKILLKIYL